MQSLEWILQALSSESKIQIQLYPDFVSITDELALDYDDVFKRIKLQIPYNNDQMQLLIDIDNILSDMSQKKNIWNLDSLKNNKEWALIRKKARLALGKFGISYQIPEKCNAKFVKGKNA